MSKDRGWDIWERNFHNAKRFFNTKGNTKTKASLKAKWFNEFKQDLIDVTQPKGLKI